MNNENISIDYVFPFINPTDMGWLKTYRRYFKSRAGGGNARFRDLGFLKYVFRGIEKNMPWINNVIILLSSETQIPEWLNPETVRIVYHNQFIPKQYLPTFNSNTIEMFLANIPNASEYIIYGNDDFFPMLPTSVNDYFTKDRKPRISYGEKSVARSPFQAMCKKIFKLVQRRLKLSSPSSSIYYKQSHGAQPITLTLLKETVNLLKNNIKRSITRKRKLSKNLSQYMYFDYAILSKQSERRDSLTEYIAYSSKRSNINTLNRLKSFIQKPSSPWLCFNDTQYTAIQHIPQIIDEFEKKFPEKSKYEL